MKIACLTLCILLLMCLSCFAVQRAKPSMIAATSPGLTKLGGKFAALPQTAAAYYSWHPIGAFEEVVSPPPAGANNQDLAQSSSAVPLLSCIGAGMALGGLISARWWQHREDK